MKIRQTFAPIMQAHGVDLVLAGHDHHYERSRSMKDEEVVPEGTGGGITYLVVGNGGTSLRPIDGEMASWGAARNDEEKGFLDVDITEGVLTARALTASGKELDRFVLSKPLPPAPPGSQPPSEEAANAPASPLSGEPTKVQEPPEGGCTTSGSATGGLALSLAAALALLTVGWRARRRAVPVRIRTRRSR
jgi:hypothetical protein